MLAAELLALGDGEKLDDSSDNQSQIGSELLKKLVSARTKQFERSEFYLALRRRQMDEIAEFATQLNISNQSANAIEHR
jgi:hypothetical protein